MPMGKKDLLTLALNARNPFILFVLVLMKKGGESKCALCVFPNRVYQYSMQFDPGSGPPSSDTSPVLDDSSD